MAKCSEHGNDPSDKPDMRRGEPGILSDSELHRTSDIVSRAADLVAELARRNRVIDAEAREVIEAHKAEAAVAHQRVAELQEGIDTLQTRMDEMAAEFQGYVHDLQGKLTSCRADLELRTREADLSREWLVYLSSEVIDRLGDAPAKLNELARETRSGLRTAAPASHPPTLGENSLTSKDEELQVSYDPDEWIQSGDQQRVVRVNRLRRRYAGIRTAGAIN